MQKISQLTSMKGKPARDVPMINAGQMNTVSVSQVT
jgi:hypothetical protein